MAPRPWIRRPTTFSGHVPWERKPLWSLALGSALSFTGLSAPFREWASQPSGLSMHWNFLTSSTRFRHATLAGCHLHRRTTSSLPPCKPIGLTSQSPEIPMVQVFRIGPPVELEDHGGVHSGNQLQVRSE